ncbi:hypothetical protein RLDS_25685 [Sphingobium lactosutens DS20]|uniref:Uncharacterized protein n=1 Tax=Sphingobium lactosutens DS20 TaxID=1331060 RepID=T0H3B4_9SPHN|nr:hypothetical protein RLDS_25685 [Sphingobium lactosutens DS20]
MMMRRLFQALGHEFAAESKYFTGYLLRIERLFPIYVGHSQSFFQPVGLMFSSMPNTLKIASTWQDFDGIE